MERIEKKISLLIEQQFPAFYREDGPTFIQFVKAYYEWLEEEGNVTYQTRRFLENRDIDETLEAFLYFFQKKYLYGIPFDVIINKRYLLKHVLDVYRSKSSIQAYKLLFKLIYNDDIDIYLPGRDVLRLSDGTWKRPYYLEINDYEGAGDLVGKTIYGLSSNITAIVENYITVPVNKNIIGMVYISNINPKGGSFVRGEKIIEHSLLNSNNIIEIIQESPNIIGSLESLEILNGGRGFEVGDLLKIIHKDSDTFLPLSAGKDGIVRVTNTSLGRGTINFSLDYEGSGISNTNFNVFVINSPFDNTGSRASFEIGYLLNTANIGYNTDLIADYADKTLNAAQFDFPLSPTGNVSSTLESTLSFDYDIFGGVGQLIEIQSGNNYTQDPSVIVRTTTTGLALPGTVSFATNNTTVTGISTEFARFFSNGDVIQLQANTSLANTKEKAIIQSITNNTVLVLRSKPSRNSTASAVHMVSPSTLKSQYAFNEYPMERNDGLTTGEDVDIDAAVSIGNNVVSAAIAVDSGKGYVHGETVQLFLYGIVNSPTIVNGGTGYTNGDIMVFNGGQPSEIAQGYVNTNSNGVITTTTLTYQGTGYISNPNIVVRTSTGNGAVLTTTISEYDNTHEVSARVITGGMGISMGRWTTTRGFLNSDKYIQDSYFYQDFSYQIKAATALSKYRDILYNTFHIAGTELFGETVILKELENDIDLISGSNTITETIGYSPSLDHREYRNSQYLNLGI